MVANKTKSQNAIILEYYLKTETKKGEEEEMNWLLACIHSQLLYFWLQSRNFKAAAIFFSTQALIKQTNKQNKWQLLDENSSFIIFTSKECFLCVHLFFFKDPQQRTHIKRQTNVAYVLR